MLSITEKPKTFREMVGQEIVKKSLLHISKEPEQSPRIILLSGEYGTGKSLAAKIFSRAINCPYKLPNGDACGDPTCPICGQEVEDSFFYTEYDSAIVGNVDTIKELRNTFYFGYEKGYRVIVLDEFQLCSKASQGALLKIFEQPDPNVFFIICTTDQDKLLPTIVSRSLLLCYNKIDIREIIDYLNKLCIKYRDRLLNLSDTEIESNIKLIANKSNGHIRNALMLLDSLFLLQKDFANTIKDNQVYYRRLLMIGLNYDDYVQNYTKSEVDKILGQLIQELSLSTISELKLDYESFVLDISKYIFDINPNSEYDAFLKGYKNSFKLFNILNDKTIYNLFEDDIQFKIALFMLIKKLSMIKEK